MQRSVLYTELLLVLIPGVIPSKDFSFGLQRAVCGCRWGSKACNAILKVRGGMRCGDAAMEEECSW